VFAEEREMEEITSVSLHLFVNPTEDGKDLNPASIDNHWKILLREFARYYAHNFSLC